MSIEKLIAKGDHDGCCEECDAPGLTDENVREGDLGFYCSEACEEAGEGGADEDWQAWERRQMGLCGA
jgi:hypothetical protein